MRNRLIFVLAIFMSLGLVGCGQGSSSDTTEPAKASAEAVQPAATDGTTPAAATIPPTAITDNVAKDAAPTTSAAAVTPPPAQASPSDLANTGVTLPPSPTTAATLPTSTTVPAATPITTIPAAPAAVPTDVTSPLVNGANPVATPTPAMPPMDNSTAKGPVLPVAPAAQVPSTPSTQAPVVVKNPATDSLSSSTANTSTADGLPSDIDNTADTNGDGDTTQSDVD